MVIPECVREPETLEVRKERARFCLHAGEHEGEA